MKPVPPCPRCRGPLDAVEALTLWTCHYVCMECRVVYVWDAGILTVCTRQREHLKEWPRTRAVTLPILPPIQAGPHCRGLL